VADRRALGVLVGMLASAALLGNVCLRRRTDLGSLESAWRFWDDTAIAIGRYLDWSDLETPRPTGELGNFDETVARYQRLVKKGTSDGAIRPCEFWRTISPDPFRRHWQPYSVPPLEDPGRAILTAAGYVALGGIAPYLALWLGALACMPVLAWISWELFDASHPTAACIFLTALVCSPYLVESLSLPHSAVGFYLVALLALVALSTYAVLGRCRSVPLLLARASAAASIFALCAICRSGTLFLAPGFILALTLASRRVLSAGEPDRPPFAGAARHGARMTLAAGLAVAFLAPYLLLRPPQHHNAWVSVWEGLGDYGAARGYSWYDIDARRFLAEQGITPFANPKQVRTEHEDAFRRAVLADVRAHPFWYAGVLARRLEATMTLRKPTRRDPAAGESRGGHKFHYKYTTPVGWFALGPWQVELPAGCLWSPIVALGAAWVAARRPRAAADVRNRLDGYATVILCVSVGALGLPVLLTTAGGIETQAFALACFLALAFLIPELVRLARTGKATPSAPDATSPNPVPRAPG